MVLRQSVGALRLGEVFGVCIPRFSCVNSRVFAFFFTVQGKHEEAEPLLRRSLAIREKALGPDHPNFAIALNNKAKSLENQVRAARKLKTNTCFEDLRMWY